MTFFRRTAVPDVVKAVAVAAGERRIAWAATPDGRAVVASSRALYLPDGTVLGWDEIERAHWEKPSLEIVELTEREGSGRRHHVDLDLEHDTDLPETVRARVSASVAWSSHVKLRPKGGVRIVGRRRVGMEVLDWQLVFDRDTDPQDPGLRAQADEHLAAARRTIG
ncbi:MAG: hypothetical protein JJD92_13475 [Frankiaceae bacterium]|nr:hypothetical protein [Frankiaceae bacterium]